MHALTLTCTCAHSDPDMRARSGSDRSMCRETGTTVGIASLELNGGSVAGEPTTAAAELPSKNVTAPALGAEEARACPLSYLDDIVEYCTVLRCHRRSKVVYRSRSLSNYFIYVGIRNICSTHTASIWLSMWYVQ